jgi:hypothetical protein
MKKVSNYLFRAALYRLLLVLSIDALFHYEVQILGLTLKNIFFQGYRLRLHFDGYSESFDFWENANSPNLFHAGWCHSKKQKLHPPKSYVGKEFKWPAYLRETDSKAAPLQAFSNRPEVSRRNSMHSPAWAFQN